MKEVRGSHALCIVMCGSICHLKTKQQINFTNAFLVYDFKKLIENY